MRENIIRKTFKNLFVYTHINFFTTKLYSINYVTYYIPLNPQIWAKATHSSINLFAYACVDKWQI